MAGNTVPMCPAGTTLGVATVAAPTVYVDVEEVFGITPPDLKVGKADTTHLSSAAREFIPTIPESGECDFSYNVLTGATGQLALAAHAAARETVNFKITYPNSNGSITFAAFVSNIAINTLDESKHLTGKVKLTVTGVATHATT